MEDNEKNDTSINGAKRRNKYVSAKKSISIILIYIQLYQKLMQTYRC